jgi:uncharacterized protein YutE (UPF0331/DUF86 family)
LLRSNSKHSSQIPTRIISPSAICTSRSRAALDIANHLIADAELESPETYRDAFAILGRHGVIAIELSKRMQLWAGFRNILVHAYLTIDHAIAWDAIVNDLDELRQLAAIASSKL